MITSDPKQCPNQNVIDSKFRVEPWAPWEGLINREVVKP